MKEKKKKKEKYRPRPRPLRLPSGAVSSVADGDNFCHHLRVPKRDRPRLNIIVRRPVPAGSPGGIFSLVRAVHLRVVGFASSVRISTFSFFPAYFFFFLRGVLLKF